MQCDSFTVNDSSSILPTLLYYGNSVNVQCDTGYRSPTGEQNFNVSCSFTGSQVELMNLSFCAGKSPTKASPKLYIWKLVSYNIIFLNFPLVEHVQTMAAVPSFLSTEVGATTETLTSTCLYPIQNLQQKRARFYRHQQNNYQQSTMS